MSQYRPVIDSYLRCIDQTYFIPRFYEHFLASDEFIKGMFQHVDFQKQHNLLRHGLMSMISYLDQHSLAGKYNFERLRETHGSQGMNIKPEHYAIWKTCMIRTIAEVDPAYHPDLSEMWDEVLNTGIRMIQRENEALN